MIRILLADDHALVRRGVRLILEQEPDLQVVAEAADGLGRARHSDATHDRPAGSCHHRPTPRAPKILMLSMHDNEQYFFGALKAGASGYVLKSVADVDLVAACRAAMRGEMFLYPSAESTLVRDYLDRLRRGDRVPSSVLTAREDQVIKLIAEGCSSREIARDLHIAVKTVESHRANILNKLGMRDRVELTRYAIRAGLVEP